MPLDESGSKASIGKNIRTELEAHPEMKQKQAVAIALDVARRAKRDAGGAASSTPWFTRHSSNLMTRGPVIGTSMGRAGIYPLITKGNLAAVTPVGQALSGSTKVSAPPHPQFPKLPKPPQIKPPKLTMKDGGHAEDRTEPTAHGPLLGNTRGRADKISTKVEDGSYIIPADIPSSSAFGQGNSLAGHAMLLKVFPNSRQNSRTQKPEFKQGGAATTQGRTVDCALSDGEFRVSRADCLKIGHGDLDKAYRILDHFVERIRHHNIETLKKLPPPVGKDD
jgi:hypothetical protein